MSKLDWFYVYSPHYEFFHNELSSTIDRNYFTPYPFYVDQFIFDEHLYKHEGEHFFSRITVKINTIIAILEERLSRNNLTPFIFTDCDILVTKYASRTLPFHAEFKEIDILFQREYLTTTEVNPGCMMITPSTRVLDFFKAVRDDILQNNVMDMDAMNNFLRSGQNKVKYTFFSTRDVCSSHTISHATFSVFHILGNCISKEADMAHKIKDYLRMSGELRDL
jgi:hypothetical protein